MLHGDGQSYKLVHKPCYINLTFLFGNYNEIVTFFGIFMTELNQQLICRADKLFHIVQTTVTWHPHHSVCLEVQFESTRCFLYN